MPDPSKHPVKHGSLNGVVHGFFYCYGGFSSGLYQSLNCGLDSQDDSDCVQANLHLVQQNLRAEHLLTLRQVHSTKVATITATSDFSIRAESDALVTKEPKIALGVLSADCAPILFADKIAGVIGAAHAGWKGALGGIAEATVAAMCDLGAERHRIAAVVGPCIAKASYEVDARFRERFTAQNPEFSEFFACGAREDYYQFDLEGFLLARLQKMSLSTVVGLGIDTYPRQNGYFSFRRSTHHNEADYGRQISAIMLD